MTERKSADTPTGLTPSIDMPPEKQRKVLMDVARSISWRHSQLQPLLFIFSSPSMARSQEPDAMSHSGNQGSDWYFLLIVAQNATAGIVRFAILLGVLLLAAALASVWLNSF